MNIANEETIEAQMMSLATEYIDETGRERTAAFLDCLARLVSPADVVVGPIFIDAEEYFSDPSNPTEDEIVNALGNLGDGDTRSEPRSLHIVNNSYTDEQIVTLRQRIAWFLDEGDELIIVDAHQGQWVVVHCLDPDKHTPGHCERLYFAHMEEAAELSDG